MKKTFGTHIENGLTELGDGIHRTIIDAKDHELETIKLGLISDEEKLRILKRDLYEAARSRANPEHIQNLLRAIATISQQLEDERKHRNSFTEHFYSIANSTILLGVLAVLMSFPATWICNGVSNHSQACQSFRVIPAAISRFFSEPK